MGAAAVCEETGLARLLGRTPWLMSLWCVVAAFGAYACMYAFRKPFTAGTYLNPPYHEGYKVWLIMAQVLGYTISKFVGIKVIAEMPPKRRAASLLMLIGTALLALLLFAVVPPPYSIVCLFLNGLPLGMVFGLVLGFLEGRRMTEAFMAGLCASFILADGFTKSVGAGLLAHGIREAWMPFCAGLVFILPLAGFVWMLRMIPPPNAADVAARSERVPMTSGERSQFLRRHGPGLFGITVAYLVITVLRSMRADFAPELWTALGAPVDAGVFTRSEMIVAFGVLAVTGLVVLVRDNRRAFFMSLWLSLAGVLLIAATLAAREAGRISPYAYMVLTGCGLYIPYVAVQTTVFERLIALTRDRANLGYLIYFADAFGYLGYVAVIVMRNFRGSGPILPLFHATAWGVVVVSLVALVLSVCFFGAQLRAPANGVAAGIPMEPAGTKG